MVLRSAPLTRSSWTTSLGNVPVYCPRSVPGISLEGNHLSEFFSSIQPQQCSIFHLPIAANSDETPPILHMEKFQAFFQTVIFSSIEPQQCSIFHLPVAANSDETPPILHMEKFQLFFQTVKCLII